MSKIKSWAAMSPKAPLQPHEFDPGPLGAEEVEIAVDYCGICHSDLSMIDNEWGMTVYPLVPGHEVVGRVVGLGGAARGLRVGQRVGLGWTRRQLHALPPVPGRRPQPVRRARCRPSSAATAASPSACAATGPGRCRCPRASAGGAGPLLCGGITVFTPLVQFGVSPTGRVGVVGIGGLGHMALKFCRAWGCEVTAFTSSDAKADEAASSARTAWSPAATATRSRAVAGSLDLMHRHGQRAARLGRAHRHARARGPAARRRRGAGADPGVTCSRCSSGQKHVGVAHRRRPRRSRRCSTSAPATASSRWSRLPDGEASTTRWTGCATARRATAGCWRAISGAEGRWRADVGPAAAVVPWGRDPRVVTCSGHFHW